MSNDEHELVVAGTEGIAMLGAVLVDWENMRRGRFGMAAPRFIAELLQQITDTLDGVSPVRHREQPIVKDSTCGAELTSNEVAALIGKSVRTIQRNPQKYREVLHGRDWRYPREFIEQLAGVHE